VSVDTGEYSHVICRFRRLQRQHVIVVDHGLNPSTSFFLTKLLHLAVPTFVINDGENRRNPCVIYSNEIYNGFVGRLVINLLNVVVGWSGEFFNRKHENIFLVPFVIGICSKLFRNRDQPRYIFSIHVYTFGLVKQRLRLSSM
jgi:hypothetical protein